MSDDFDLLRFDVANTRRVRSSERQGVVVAALDRIEAELTRLRSEQKATEESYINAHVSLQARDAELAKLRESNEKFEVRFLDQQSENDRLREENERLIKLIDYLRAGEVNIDEQERLWNETQDELTRMRTRLRVNSEAWHYRIAKGRDYAHIPSHMGRWDDCTNEGCVKDRNSLKETNDY